MATAIVTGSGGLIGSESVKHFVEAGHDVIGIDNDMRARFLGSDASTFHTAERLADVCRFFRTIDADIRDLDAIERTFHEVAATLELVIRTAARPSHDWAASEPRRTSR
jgi:CDP-paratose 2-epimerase